MNRATEIRFAGLDNARFKLFLQIGLNGRLHPGGIAAEGFHRRGPPAVLEDHGHRFHLGTARWLRYENFFVFFQNLTHLLFFRRSQLANRVGGLGLGLIGEEEFVGGHLPPIHIGKSAIPIA